MTQKRGCTDVARAHYVLEHLALKAVRLRSKLAGAPPYASAFHLFIFHIQRPDLCKEPHRTDLCEKLCALINIDPSGRQEYAYISSNRKGVIQPTGYLVTTVTVSRYKPLNQPLPHRNGFSHARPGLVWEF